MQEVPTYTEVVDSMSDFRKMEKLIKNKTVASQFSQTVTANFSSTKDHDEIQQVKSKFDRNVIIPKKFPVKAETYQYPDPILKEGNILYRTSNRDYGSRLPQKIDIPVKFFPRDAKYTTSFPDNFKFDGLNTAVNFSKVHKKLDEY